MLRDSLTKISGVSTWPCDEINYIFLHGNLFRKHDRFTKKNINHSSTRYIKNSFWQLSKMTKSNIIVEKTCANSLRIPFLKIIHPEAYFICIFRNGNDVIPSAVKKWVSKPDIKYLYKKLKYIPLQDLPFQVQALDFHYDLHQPPQ